MVAGVNEYVFPIVDIQKQEFGDPQCGVFSLNNQAFYFSMRAVNKEFLFCRSETSLDRRCG